MRKEQLDRGRHHLTQVIKVKVTSDETKQPKEPSDVLQ